MSRKTIKSLTPSLDAMRKAILETIDELFTEHGDEIEAHIDESDKKAATVNFACELDNSTAESSVKTRIRFSQTVTDMRLARIDDPKQGQFKIFDQAGLTAERQEADEQEQKQADKADKESKKAKAAQAKADAKAAKEAEKAQKAAAKLADKEAKDAAKAAQKAAEANAPGTRTRKVKVKKSAEQPPEPVAQE